MDKNTEEENTIKKLIDETLSILSELGWNLPILLKPHIITDMSFMKENVNKYSSSNIYFTYLHPTALSINAKLVISNYYSTSQADAHFFWS